MLALRGVFRLWLAMVERLEAELVCYVGACDFFVFWTICCVWELF